MNVPVKVPFETAGFEPLPTLVNPLQVELVALYPKVTASGVDELVGAGMLLPVTLTVAPGAPDVVLRVIEGDEDDEPVTVNLLVLVSVAGVLPVIVAHT